MNINEDLFKKRITGLAVVLQRRDDTNPEWKALFDLACNNMIDCLAEHGFKTHDLSLHKAEPENTIPINEAKELAKNYGKDEVIIFSFTNDKNLNTIFAYSSWGRNARHCAQAQKFGDSVFNTLIKFTGGKRRN